jgi:hypothetical protein
MKNFKIFLEERFDQNGLVIASILNSPKRQHYEAIIKKIYSSKYGVSSQLEGKEIQFVGGPSSWGNKSLNIGDLALIFIRDIDGVFHECPWRGHMVLQEIEGELHAVFQMPNEWPMDDVPTEVAEGMREDPRSKYYSIIPFILLEPYLKQLISEIGTTTKLRYHQYWLKCADCEKESRFPVYEHDGYMLMRNPKNEADCRLWDWDDQTSKEVNQLAKKYEAIIIADLVKNPLHKKIIRNSVPIEQKCFSHICDPSNGVKYHLNTEPVCPHCHSHNIKGWGPTENPYETIDLEIPYITHHYWDSLVQDEKEKIIHDEVYRLVTDKLRELETRDAKQ